MPARARGLATRAQMGRAAAAAFAVALAGGGVMGWLSLVNFLTALALGFVVGSAAFIASQRHRDATIQGLAGAAALVGIVFAAVFGALFVWGGADAEGIGAKRHFEDFARAHSLDARFKVIEGSNHNFYSREWEGRLISLSAGFLVERPSA